MNNNLKWKKKLIFFPHEIFLRTGHAICPTHLAELEWSVLDNESKWIFRLLQRCQFGWQISMEHWAERCVSEFNSFDIFVELSCILGKNGYALLSVPILDHVISIHYKLLLLSCWGFVSIIVKSYFVVLNHANCVTECFATSCHL